MKKNLCIVMMMAALMLWGCSREEKQAEETATPPATPAVEQAMDKAKEASEAVANKVEKTTEAVEKKVEKQVAKVEEKIGETAEQVKAAATKPATTVEFVTIDNKNGKVVLPHKKHAEAFGCAACHGDKKPGPQKLGKDAAHALCQGCHKEKKSGPTNCNQCHQKKAKATEGC